MAAKRILLVDGSFLSAHSWSGGRIQFEGEFSHEPVGLEALSAYLKKHRSSIFYLLADVAEEGFQLEDVPYVQGGDRAALLQRRLSQYYYSTSLATAVSLGRDKTGRRDEKILFSALTRIETFTPWLDTLREAESVLAGVYSVPMVLAGCAPQLVGMEGPRLLVTLTRGGVRQSFFDDGKLHFSRLSQLATRSIEEIGRACANDSAKIYQYLVAQRRLPRGTTLRAHVLAQAAQIPAIQALCRDTDEIKFEFVDLEATSRKHRCKESVTDSSADHLVMHCLATKTPSQQFAPAAERRMYRLWQVRFALTNAAWLALAGCLLLAGRTTLNLYEVRDKTAAIIASTAADDQRYKAILAALPKVNISPENLRALIGKLESMQKQAPGLNPLLLHLSRALNESPRIELVRIAWRIGERPDPGRKSQDDSRSGAGTSTSGGWFVMDVHGQLPLALVADQRAQLELIESFVARLRNPQTDVRVTGRPFDIDSDKALKSSSIRNDSPLVDAPKFALQIARQM